MIIKQREERYLVVIYLQSNTSNNLIKTHILRSIDIHDRRREKELCGGYLQPSTSNNNLMKLTV